MAKPLDIQSKFMGVFKTSNVYFLCACIGLFLITFQLWVRIFGFLPTVVFIVAFMTLSVTFIGISNCYPSGFFHHFFLFKTANQVFIPGYEPVNPPKKDS
jgi:hypothetical protein